MVTATYPGVYIQELTSAVHTITGVATSIGAFVGYTSRGIDQRAELVFNFSDYERLFGGLASNSELSYGVQQFFANGGTQAYVVRVPRIGASGAAVAFGNLTFTALSSGAWANGQLLIDVDSNGIAQPLAGPVTVTNGSATVAGSGFKTTLQVNQWLVFANDPSQTPYKISAIGSNVSLTLAQAFSAVSGTTTAVVIVDPTAFNLTITNLADGSTPESFPNLSLNSGLKNFVANVVNDIDNGSQLVQVAVAGAITPTTPPPMTGIVGSTLVISSVDALFGGTAVQGAMNVTSGSATVTGSGTALLAVNQMLVFASDPTATPYKVTVVGGGSATVAPPYAGASTTTTAVIMNSGAPPVLAGTVTVALNSASVVGVGTSFLNGLKVGQSILFSADTTKTLYQVSAITGDLNLTLTQKYTGAASTTATISQVNTTALANYAVQFSTSSPATAPSPLPLTIMVLAQNTPIPQTVSGLASQLQKAINSALAVQMPGASVVCSTAGTGVGQAIRINAMLPQFPDAVIAITAPPATSGLQDASVALGLRTPSSINVAHYALGTNNSSAGVALAGTVALVAASAAVVGTGTTFTNWTPGQLLVFAADTSETAYQISTITDATHLTLTSAYTGTAAAASAATVSSWGGDEASSVPGLDGTGLPGSSQLIGDPGTSTGIYALQNVDAFNLLCIPDATRAYAGNPSALDSSVDPNAIYSAAAALCYTKRAFLLVDCPPNVNTVSGAVDWKSTGLTVSSSNGAAFFPRLRLPDPLNNYNLRTFAPCGVVAGLYAQTDATRGVSKAPAGTTAVLAGVQSLICKMSDAENGVLNPLGLNCFRTFPVYGNVLWGARTLVGADAQTNQWKYVPVRRVALFLESSLYQGTQWVVFEPNDEPLWSAIRLNISSFMQTLFRKGYFQGTTPSQAYFVKCDGETTTQTDIDNGIVNIVVGFAPLKPAEFVIIQIEQLAGRTGS